MTDTGLVLDSPQTRWPQTHWDLKDLLPEPSEEVLGAEIRALEAATSAFEQRRDRKSTRLNSSHLLLSRMPSSA